MPGDNVAMCLFNEAGASKPRKTINCVARNHNNSCFNKAAANTRGSVPNTALPNQSGLLPNLNVPTRLRRNVAIIMMAF